MSVPSALRRPRVAVAARVLAAVLGGTALAAAAQAPEPVAAEDTGRAESGGAWPRVMALGLSTNHRPVYPGAADQKWGLAPQFVLRWGRLTLSNGGTLASRAGEPAESGLSAEVFSRDRLSVRAALRVDEGRRSDEIPRLRGLPDIPVHLRGRVQVGWRLHPQWELLGVWRSDVSGRGTGHSTEAVLLHEWRPEFLDHRRWRVSAGVAAQWRNATQARLLYGVRPEDASASAYPAFDPGAGWTDARLFANWRRELDGAWVAYGGITAETLVRQALDSPLVERPRAFTFSFGLGRRF